MAVARYYNHDAGEWVLLAAGRDGAPGVSSWDDITGKPEAYPPADHTHTWNDVSAKPASFPPSVHSHVAADVDGLQDELDGKAAVSHDHTVGQVTGLQDELDSKAPVSHQHSWDDVTGKPATYPPESHSHAASDISDATATGRSVLTAASQAAARQAIGAGTSNLTLGTTSSTAAAGDHTHSEYAESSRVTALEDSQPIIVSSLPASPLPGRIYLVTG